MRTGNCRAAGRSGPVTKRLNHPGLREKPGTGNAIVDGRFQAGAARWGASAQTVNALSSCAIEWVCWLRRLTGPIHLLSSARFREARPARRYSSEVLYSGLVRVLALGTRLSR